MVDWRRPRNILILLIVAFVISAMVVKAYVIEINTDARNALVIVFLFAITSILAAKYLPSLRKNKIMEPNLIDAEENVKKKWKEKRSMTDQSEVSWEMGKGEKTYFDKINPTFAFIFMIKSGTAEEKQIRIIADHNYQIVEWTDDPLYIDLDDIWKCYNHGHPGSPSPTPLEIHHPIFHKPGFEINVNPQQDKKGETDITSSSSLAKKK